MGCSSARLPAGIVPNYFVILVILGNAFLCFYQIASFLAQDEHTQSTTSPMRDENQEESKTWLFEPRGSNLPESEKSIPGSDRANADLPASGDQETVAIGDKETRKNRQAESQGADAYEAVPTGVWDPSTDGSKSVDATVDVNPADLACMEFNRTNKSADAKKLRGLEIGDYLVLKELGRGGMGVVYQARHKTLDRLVAIKMILSGIHGSSSVGDRFLAEAKAVAALQHPGIVQIYEIGEHESLPFIALEFVGGGDLQSEIRSGVAWGAKRAAELVAHLCDAMQYAHDRNILHRDIKPANILLDEQKRPKVSDFGLAKKLDGTDHLTKDGTIVGTPSYMPPEQARGESSKITERSDIYSLGALLYHLITGRVPFVSDSMMETLTQVIERDPIQPRQLQPGIPIDLETICIKCLQKDPNARYGSCREMAEDLRRFCNGEPILARPISNWERAVRWCRRNPKIAVPSGLSLLFIFSTLFVSLWAWRTTAAQAVLIAQERDDANTQKAIAEAQEKEATRQSIIANEQKKLAEDNAEIAAKQAKLALESIQFIVTDIDTQLLSRPGSSELRLAIMEAVSKKWDDLDVGLVGGIRGEAIPTLMAVRQRLATTFIQLDRIEDAAKELEKLEAKARERIVVKQGTDAARINLARILLSSSSLQRRIQKPELVAVKLKEMASVLEEVLAKPNPEGAPTDTLIVRQLLAVAHQNLGVDLLRNGKIVATTEAFSKALEINQSVLAEMEAAKPGANVVGREAQIRELKISIDKSRLGLAYLLMRLGKQEEATVRYRESIESRRSELAKYPNELGTQSALANQLALYGRALLWTGNLDEAESALLEAMKLSEAVYKGDPEKADYKRDLAFACYNAGVLRDLQGKSDLALGVLERSRLLRSELFEKSSDDRNRMFLMQSEARVGNVERAERLSDELLTNVSTEAEFHIERACALAQISLHSESRREEFVEESLAALEKGVELGYEDPFRISREPDLMPLKESLRYRAVVDRLNQVARERSEAVPK